MTWFREMYLHRLAFANRRQSRSDSIVRRVTIAILDSTFPVVLCESLRLSAQFGEAFFFGRHQFW